MTKAHTVPLSVIKREIKVKRDHSRPIFSLEMSKCSPGPSTYKQESSFGSTNQQLYYSPAKSFKNNNVYLNKVDL